MSSKKPNSSLAPAVIAGVTVAFLAAGYQFVFGNKKNQPQPTKPLAATQTEPPKVQ